MHSVRTSDVQRRVRFQQRLAHNDENCDQRKTVRRPERDARSTKVLIENEAIAEVSGSAGRPGGMNVVDLSDRTVSPGFIDAPIHLCVEGPNLARQTFQCAPAKALAGLHHAQPFALWPLA
jgi:imidazolonepropionase-like amidohydrolase